MESAGTPDHIQVTRATYELTRDEFDLEPRGTVSVKGKGDMETWYLVGQRVAIEPEVDRVEAPASAAPLQAG